MLKKSWLYRLVIAVLLLSICTLWIAPGVKAESPEETNDRSSEEGRQSRMVYSPNETATGKIDTYLGVTKDIVSWLKSHENDGYYLNTKYVGTFEDAASCIRPKGEYSSNAGMNCTGFVASVIKKNGGDLSKILTRLDGSYANACNWQDTVHKKGCQTYRYSSISKMLSGGKLEKGDIIYFEPDWTEENADCHIGFFWGDSSSENKFWHSTKDDANAITEIKSKTGYKYVYIFKTQKRGGIQIQKSSANETLTAGNGNYSLKGAVYKLYNGNGKEIVSLTTDENGKANAGNLPAGTYTMKEVTAPKGYFVDETVYPITIKNGQVTTKKLTDKPMNGKVELYKSSSNTEVTGRNGAYSLKGAVYTLYKGSAAVATLTTDETGYAEVSGIPLGTYTLRETTAPTGYKLDKTVANVTLTSDKRTVTVKMTDEPIVKTVDLMLRKIDAQTGDKTPQGAAFLEGAEYTLKYYDGFYKDPSELEGKTAKRTWVLKTDKNGYCKLKKAYLVSGDPFYYDKSGNEILPLGTVTIQETKAPEGYLLNEELQIRQIKEEERTGKIADYNESISKESVIKGAVKIVKFGANSDDTSSLKKALEGIKFVFTSKTNGNAYSLVTGSDGEGRLEDLPYDTYTVTEEDTPSGYGACVPFEVTVKDHGEVLSYIIENKEVRGALSVVKKDAQSGKVIQAAGTKFRILDAQKNPISMRVTYPSNTYIDTFETDDTGSFTLPERLVYGKYYLEEVAAPNGYLKGELLPFTVDRTSDWSKPQVITYCDENVKGQIELTKVSASGGALLAGAEFDVIAAEDVITPDGTLRAKAGTIVDHVTTGKDGKAVTGELFLGKYLVKETKAPEGYALSTKEYKAELLYKDQNTKLVVKKLDPIENAPTTVVVKKVRLGTEERLEGVRFNIWEKETKDTEEGSEAEKKEFITDQEGLIKIENLLPDTTYCIQETETLPGYVVNPEIFEIVVDENGLIDGEDTCELVVENDYTKLLSTIALDKKSGTQKVRPDDEVTIVDYVALENLVPGEEYVLKGIAMDKETGERVFVKEKEIQAEKIFEADRAEEVIENVFTFDGSELAGKRIVFFEKLYLKDCLVDEHTDLEDLAQTISFEEKEVLEVKASSNPITGENGRILVYVFALITALGVVLGIFYYRRKW